MIAKTTEHLLNGWSGIRRFKRFLKSILTTKPYGVVTQLTPDEMQRLAVIRERKEML